MARPPDSGHIDLAEVFRRVQTEMLAQLAVGRLFEHASAAGSASEHHWLELFDRYLPQRYRAAPAFVINSAGSRSRQIDLAIFDSLSSPRLFPHSAGVHIPVESVYAVFEIKPTFSRQWLGDAGEKAASVRALKSPRSRRPVLAGLLATGSVWTPGTFSKNLRSALRGHLGDRRLDFGCSLEFGAFECPRRTGPVLVSHQEDALIFFILRFLDRLRSLGPAPAADLMRYARDALSPKTDRLRPPTGATSEPRR